MPDSNKNQLLKEVVKIGLQFQTSEQLQQGWQQWLVNFSDVDNLLVSPRDKLVYGNHQLYILWQNQDGSLLTLASPQLLLQSQKEHFWSEFNLHRCMPDSSNQQKIIFSEQSDTNLEDTELLKSKLMVCRNFGIFAAIHQIQIWRQQQRNIAPIVLLSEALPGWPMPLQPSRLLSSNLPTAAIGSLLLLDDWKILARFSTTDLHPGCYQGELEEMVEYFLKRKPANDWDMSHWQ